MLHFFGACSKKDKYKIENGAWCKHQVVCMVHGQKQWFRIPPREKSWIHEIWLRCLPKVFWFFLHLGWLKKFPGLKKLPILQTWSTGNGNGGVGVQNPENSADILNAGTGDIIPQIFTPRRFLSALDKLCKCMFKIPRILHTYLMEAPDTSVKKS